MMWSVDPLCPDKRRKAGRHNGEGVEVLGLEGLFLTRYNFLCGVGCR